MGIGGHWAASLNGYWSFSNYKFKDPTIVDKVKTSSWGIRGGADVYIPVTDKFAIYMGPGVLYSRAKIKHEVEPTAGVSVEIDNPFTNSLSLAGRFGGFYKLSTNFGIYGNIGKQFTYSWFSVNSGGVDNDLTWWTSSLDAHMGFAVMFGGTSGQ